MFEQSALTQATTDSESVTPPRGFSEPVLPAQPLVVIEAKTSLSALDLRDVWAYRELLYFLTWRDLKVRYKQTLLGVVWVVLQPLMLTVIFTVFLSMLVRVPSDGLPYPVFVYAGLLPWTFFSGAVSGGGNSLVTNAHLVTKVYFPRLIVPTASVAGRLVDFAIAFGILAGLLAYYRVVPTWNMLALLPLVALTTLLALGCATLLSALNVKYRDIGIVLPVFMQFWMYVSPVIYPSRLVYERLGRWGWLYSLNPLVGILDGFRAALFGSAFNRFALGVSVASALGLFFLSILVFRRVEGSFADLI
ncbi:MAG: lipopolysaccharide transport system permease protein [Acidobacteriota bacterium]|nr:lipopolysaccharide transport system permease protein [Acidobacteriota bacterium]